MRKSRGHGRRRAPNTLHREVLTQRSDRRPKSKPWESYEEHLAPLADEVTEQWEWKVFPPACVRDRTSSEEISAARIVYFCPNQRDSMSPDGRASSSGPLPSSEVVDRRGGLLPQAIPGGVAGPGLLAQVVVSKSTDHLPLNRQERDLPAVGLGIVLGKRCVRLVVGLCRVVPAVGRVDGRSSG